MFYATERERNGNFSATFSLILGTYGIKLMSAYFKKLLTLSIFSHKTKDMAENKTQLFC